MKGKKIEKTRCIGQIRMRHGVLVSFNLQFDKV